MTGTIISAVTFCGWDIVAAIARLALIAALVIILVRFRRREGELKEELLSQSAAEIEKTYGEKSGEDVIKETDKEVPYEEEH